MLSKRAERSFICLRLNSVIRPCIIIRFKLCCWTVSLLPSSWFSFAWAVEAQMFLYWTDLKGKVNCNVLFYQPYQITPVKQLVKLEIGRHAIIGLCSNGRNKYWSILYKALFLLLTHSCAIFSVCQALFRSLSLFVNCCSTSPANAPSSVSTLILIREFFCLQMFGLMHNKYIFIWFFVLVEARHRWREDTFKTLS